MFCKNSYVEIDPHVVDCDFNPPRDWVHFSHSVEQDVDCALQEQNNNMFILIIILKEHFKMLYLQLQ